jgi:hypothetical protein
MRRQISGHHKVLAGIIIIALTAGIGWIYSDRSESSGDGDDHIVVEEHGSVMRYDSVSDLSWRATHIVTGTITDELEPVKEDPVSGPSSSERSQHPTVYTDTIVEVDKTFRGDVRETVIIRQAGGTVDNLTTRVSPTVHFQSDERVLLFLHDISDRQHADENMFHVVGVDQGKWEFTEAGTVEARLGKMELGAVIDEIRDALSEDQQGGDSVPLDQSPAGPDLPD